MMGIAHRLDEEPGQIEFGPSGGRAGMDPVLAARAGELDPSKEAGKRQAGADSVKRRDGAEGQPLGPGMRDGRWGEEDDRISDEDLRRLMREERGEATGEISEEGEDRLRGAVPRAG